MKYDDMEESTDVDDRRGDEPERDAQGAGGVPTGLLFNLLPFLLRSKLGWAILILGALGYVAVNLLGGGSSAPSHPSGSQGSQASAHVTQSAHEAKDRHIVLAVHKDVQDTWTKLLPEQTQKPYRHAEMVLFRDATRTACGLGQSATGPFYCPSDEHVYIDLGFYDELSKKLGAKGDFAKGYVVAHEIGHHIQKILGIEAKVSAMQGPSKGADGSSVRTELQADCFAGVWAHSAGERGELEAGDIESAVSAAQSIGDDRLQKMSAGTVSPEKWTHGSSAERVRWFTTGYKSGKVSACDTFAATTL